MKTSKTQSQVQVALREIEKQFGHGAAWMMSDTCAKGAIDIVPTGSISLNRALGVGGLPRGRVVEIYGPESTGKTTLVLEAIAQLHKKGGKAAYIDAEHALDLSYAKCLGVNPELLLISQPDHGEQALDIADTLVRSGAVDLVVIDSVAALVPRAELEGDMGDSHMGLQARLMSQALRKLTSSANRTGTLVIFINQLRHKIGVMFGSPEVTTGGNALKYYASVRLDIRRVSTIKKGDEARGNRVRVRVVKNKVAPPLGQAEFDILYGTGIDATGDLLDTAVKDEVVTKNGAWFSYQSEKIGQGRERACLWLEANDTMRQEILACTLSRPDAPQRAETG
ncbi:MAG: recombinase RecA [Bradymonadia bacterium]